MKRPGLVALVSMPLIVAGTEAAHLVAYRIAYPNPVERAAALSASGHGYFAALPLVLAIGLALVACGLMCRASQSRRDRGPVRVPAAPFAALPPATFVLQEHLERLVHDGALPFGTALEPTFLLGLALQLPFALAVYGIARLLLRAAERLGSLLGTAPPRRRPATPPGRRARPGAILLPRLAPIAAGSSGRGPPSGRPEAFPLHFASA